MLEPSHSFHKHWRKRKALYVFPLLVVLLYSFTLENPIEAKEKTIAGRAQVIDADTIIVKNQRIRLHGIDAPETGQTCKNDESGLWACGRKATIELKKLLQDNEVKCVGTKKDRYKRLIAVCLLDKKNINGWLVLNGWAMAYRKYSTDYISLEREAKLNQSGLWIGDFVMPWKWRRGARLPILSDKKKIKCCRICSKGQACGDGCISVNYICRKPIGCACNQD